MVTIPTTVFKLQEQHSFFHNDVPEKVIQEVTGHRSTKALRQYERVAVQQKQVASNILTGGRGVGQSSVTSAFQAPFGMAPGNFPMPVISPVFNNGHGTINFTVNVCPGNVSVGANCSEASYEKLLEGIDLKDLQ
jgi:hypothetical protein